MGTIRKYDINLGKWIIVGGSEAQNITITDTSILDDIKENNLESILKKYKTDIDLLKSNVAWLAKYGGGGGGNTPIEELSTVYYYGSLDNKLINSEILTLLNKSKEITNNITLDKSYYYIVLYENYILTKVLTSNNENITDGFKHIDNISLENKNYKIYEFHLNSGIALDVDATISITIKE